ncbi:putative baculoviral IAP repeat-containing protein [Cladorrhinum sp. PSN259]|nr:putative baculoviral IAP repeat-containing protein [Cladorrhinum sp. PSN259]
MPQFREKLGKGFSKVHGIFRPSKRRISEDNEPSQQSKQLRTGQEQPLRPPSSDDSIPDSSSSAQHFSTQSTPPSSASGTMNNYYVVGSSGLPGTMNNPIDPTQASSRPGASSQNPIDLTRLDSGGFKSVREIPNFAHATDESMFLDPRVRQIIDDEAIARILQDEQEQETWPVTTGPVSLGGAEELTRWKTVLNTRRCGNCSSKTVLLPNDKNIVAQTKRMIERGFLHPFTQCQNCKYWNCVGCQLKSHGNIPSTANTVSAGKSLKMAWCCDTGRLFILFSLLCGFESSSDMKKTTSQPKPSSSKAKPPPCQPKQDSLKGTIPNAFSKGTGYGAGPNIITSLVPKPKKTKIDAPEAEGYFLALASALPCVDREHAATFDHTRHLTVSAILPRSPMLRLASEILRTAAIDEINARHDVINAVLTFFENLANHWDTAPIMYQEQILYPPNQQLLGYTFPAPTTTGPNTRSKSSQPRRGDAVPETGQSLFGVIQDSAVTARVYVEAATKRADLMEANDDDTRLLATARRISELAQFLKRQQVVAPEMGPKELDPAPNVVTRSKNEKENAIAPTAFDMEQWHREHCAKGVSEAELRQNYVFATEADKVNTVTLAPNRMKKLFTQTSSMHAPHALPNGIYVRYGEDRPDILKALIIGPPNTPYENGIFEFDILCRAEFPQKAPVVTFRTTGGGKVRFNPNLYQNGTVCLSLLGTWNGNPWDPAVSTISQILISIQSMIFVEFPYYNEPGYEHRPSTEQAEKYNRDIEPFVIRHGMLDWLAPNAVNPLWSDIVRKHFEVNGDKILDKVRVWASFNDTKITFDLDEKLEKALKASNNNNGSGNSE